MAKQVIDIGTTKNDGSGDTLRAGAQKINDNFTELYNALGATSGQLSLVSQLRAGDGIELSAGTGNILVSNAKATTISLGGIIVGDNLTIDNDGVLSAVPGSYALPIATGGTLGGIKVGTTLTISETGVVNVVDDFYTLPTASSSTLGGVKVGARLTITNGVLSADVQTIPTATTSVLGGVKIDGITIGINGSGVISVLSSGTSLNNGDHSFVLNSDGTLSLDGELFTGSGGSGDRLNSGQTEFILNIDGSITFPTLSTTNWEDGTLTGPTLQLGNDPTSQVLITGPAPNSDNASAQRLVIQGQQGYGGENNTKGEGGDVYIWAGSGGDGGAIDPRGDGGDVKLRGGHGGNNGGYIRIESGDAQAENGTGGFVDITAGNASNTNGTGGNVNIDAGGGNAFGGNVNINAGPGDNNTGGTVNISGGYGSVTGGNVEIVAGGGTTSGNVSVSAGNGGWEFKQDGSFSLNYNEVHIATNNWGIGVGGGTGATGVVYTAKNSDLSSIRVHATIEGDEDGDTTGFHTQACDMMIVRRISNTNVNTVDSVVYGVIYTGAGPLASLDAQWNSVSNKIEITATPTSTTNNVYVKIYATEVARGD